MHTVYILNSLLLQIWRVFTFRESKLSSHCCKSIDAFRRTFQILFYNYANLCQLYAYFKSFLITGDNWSSGSYSCPEISGLVVRVPLCAYAPGQVILSTICLSRPRCSKWVPGRNLFLLMPLRHRQRG